MQLNGEKCHLKGISCRKWTKRLNLNDSEIYDVYGFVS